MDPSSLDVERCRERSVAWQTRERQPKSRYQTPTSLHDAVERIAANDPTLGFVEFDLDLLPGELAFPVYTPSILAIYP